MAVGWAEVTAVQWGDLRFGLLKGRPGSVLQHPRELQIKKETGVSRTHSNDSALSQASDTTNSKGNSSVSPD